jgi:ATP-dependent RNA helicase RhlE
MLFSQLGLSQPILRALEQEGYSAPTPIQAQTIPHAVAGRDVLGSARTGTGKTAAFALPILHRLSTAAIDKTHRGPRKARALILSPTRELACQIADSFTSYGRGTHLSHTVIYGGVSQRHQERAIRGGVDVIVATPGRLMDLMEQRIVDLSAIEIFVLDEADRMLDMGFIQPIRRIASAIKPGANRQTLLFSATMPKEIVHLANSLLRDPVKIAVDPVSSAVPKIQQALYMVPRQTKQALLEHLLADPAAKVTRALIFTRTKHGADKVGKKLWQVGIQAETIHGNKSQSQRKRALDRFSSGAARVLVATDVAARGLDVDDISHVFNFDLPVEPEAYVHRIGRTGRAGAEGVALSFCDSEERGSLRDIERLTGTKIAIRETPAVTARPAWREHAEATAGSAPFADHASRPQRPHPQPSKQNTHRNAPAKPGSRGPGPRRPWNGRKGKPAANRFRSR